jgi:nucleotide-binding universal stress UspA family protein
MIDPPYQTVAVASTFSPRFLQVLAEAKRVRDRLCRELQLIYVGERDQTTTKKFSSAFVELDLPADSIIHYQQAKDPATAILEVANETGIDLIVAGALEKEAALRQYLGNVARRLVRDATCSVMLFTEPDQEPKQLCRIVLLAEYSDHGRAALHKALRLAELEQCEKLFVVRLYTTFDEARAKSRKKPAKAGSEGARTLEEEEAALEQFIDSAGPTDVPIEARCIRGNTGYAVLDFVQSIEATMLVVPDDPETVGLPTHIEWVTDVIPCNLWIIR